MSASGWLIVLTIGQGLSAVALLRQMRVERARRIDEGRVLYNRGWDDGVAVYTLVVSQLEQRLRQVATEVPGEPEVDDQATDDDPTTDAESDVHGLDPRS